jgi:hypothetical protein
LDLGAKWNGYNSSEKEGMMRFTKRLYSRGAWFSAFSVLLLFMFTLFPQVHALTLSVVDPGGNPIPVGYRWLVEEDVTFHPDPNAAFPVPDPNALGTNFHKSYMPMVAEGISADLSALNALDPTKHYFISILPDSDYGMGGGRVLPSQANLTVTVNSLPTPTAQISAFVFHDNAPINNAPDLPREAGLAGFRIILEEPAGRFGAAGGPVFWDAYGNPLGTTYQTVGGSYVYDAAGNPVVETLGSGIILTNANGVAVIKNLPPSKYGTRVIPPDDTWIQTSTIEGSKVIDAWVKANEPPYFTEFGPAGHHVEFGFVQLMNNIPAGGAATISGQVVSVHMSRPPNYTFYSGNPFPGSYVGLNNVVNGVGAGIFAAECDANSNFTIPNVPAGNYQLVAWDKNLDMIFASKGLTINDAGQCLQQDGTYGTCNLGQVAVFDWFSHLRGSVFMDTVDENGFPDPGEIGLPDQVVNLRWRDGSLYQSTTTNSAGEYVFDEVFPFFSWLVAEVDFARYKATGATIVVDGGGQVLPHNGWTWPSYGRLNPQVQDHINPITGNALSRTESGPVLSQAFQGFLGQTNVIHWGKTNYGPGPDGIFGTQDDENGGISGIVFYDVTRAEDDPRYNVGELWQPGIPNVTVNLYRIDGRDGGGKPNALTLINQTQTDSWDASEPNGCPGEATDIFYMDGKCYDGLRNFNQVRPGVFDGGYAFTSHFQPSFGAPDAVEVEGLPAGSYVVEVVPASPYKVVKSQDKNVDFGESYSISPLALPPVCAGDAYTVPATLTLFPGVDAPLAGSILNDCNRKEVTVQPAKNAPADFFLFTEVPPSAHVVGFILNDLANEFDPNNPNFGEKFPLGLAPVSFRDYNGREITRIYSDQYGNYNALVPSTFSANVGNPSGFSPNMLIACMNDPGPILDTNPVSPTFNQYITDPQFKSQYTQFCYTFQYMPAVTTYLDTPVLPIAAFAGQNQNVLDCEFPDGTPIIRSAVNTTYNGPYVEPGAMSLQITSMETTAVPNPEGTPAMITRDYGFGTTPGTVKIGDTLLTSVAWSAGVITATVPAGTPTGQLSVTRGDNNLSTRMGITVTVGPIAGALHTVSPAGGYPASPIQDKIDIAQPGDLILVAPGNYDELVIMSKEVQLQGSGAPVTVINAVKAPGEKLQNWRNDITTLVNSGTVSLLPGQVLDFDPANNEPGLFNTSEGPGIMVLGKAAGDPLASTWIGTGRIDGFSLMGSDIGGGIVVNGYTNGLRISNNRIIANGGLYGGGITIGEPMILQEPVDAQNDNLKIDHNHITQNGAMTGGAGGIALFTGADGYQVTENNICGNFTQGSGGGIGHLGLSIDGLIARNDILFNQSFNQLPASNSAGGGLAVEGFVEAGGVTYGTGPLVIDSNRFQGNLAGAGDGGAIRLAFVDGVDAATPYTIDIINNMIVNNVSGLAGGAISLQDALNVRIVHNTIANNDSSATAGDAFLAGPNVSTPQPAGIVSRAHSPSLAAVVGGGFSNPQLLNNIILHNRSFYWDVSANGGIGGLLPLPDAPVYNDLAVLGTTGSLDPRSCLLTSTDGYDPSNVSGDPGFVQEYFNGNSTLTTIPEDTTPLTTAAAVDEGGNFIDVRFGPLQPLGNYHITSTSPAINAGADISSLAILRLSADFDGEDRNPTTPDIGADEMAAVATDIVTITNVEYIASRNRLLVEATSSAQPSVTLTAEGFGELIWDSSRNLYRRVFTNVPVKPSSVTVNSSGGGSDTYTSDTVNISRLAYNATRDQLLVEATSSAQPSVTLNAVGYGSLLWDGARNLYRRVFSNVADKPADVTVISSGGGSATLSVP